MGRTLRCLATALVAATLATVLGLLAAPGASAQPDPGAAERQFLTLLNLARQAEGLEPMVRDASLDGVALEWSGRLRHDGVLSHRPDLATAIARVEPAWRRGGENVGVGGEVPALHDAFMASPAHRDNVLGPFNRVGIGVVAEDDGRMWVTFNFLEGPAVGGTTGLEPTAPAAAAGSGQGDGWLVTADGHVRAFGEAPAFGDLGGGPLNRPIVGMVSTASGQGYWLVASDGGIFAFGDAAFHGSTGGIQLNRPIVGMATTPTGQGYWLVASDGGIFAFGDAAFHGSTGGIQLNRPIVGMAATPTGQGYWLVASDGGVFAFGDAAFHGSTGDRRLGAAANGIATTPSGHGYWIVDGTGEVHAFGDAGFHGSAAGQGGGQPFTRIATTPDGAGYRLATADGRVFSFGSAGSGVTAPLGLRSPVVALANRA